MIPAMTMSIKADAARTVISRSCRKEQPVKAALETHNSSVLPSAYDH